MIFIEVLSKYQVFSHNYFNLVQLLFLKLVERGEEGGVLICTSNLARALSGRVLSVMITHFQFYTIFGYQYIQLNFLGKKIDYIAGENCCFNDSRVDFYLEYEPHPSSAKNLHHLFQSMLFNIYLGSFFQSGCTLPANFSHLHIV